MNSNATEGILKQLFKKAQSIKPNNAAAIFGTSHEEIATQELVKSIVDLTKEVRSKNNHKSAFKGMISALNSAVLTGVISQSESNDYYTLADQLWIELEGAKG